MTEQYIYSRSEREFTNALHQTIPLGFGFMAFSPGMNWELKRDAAVHCEDCPRLSQTDKEGAPLPLVRKVRLPKGQVLLQGSAWIEKGSRDFHVAHGYVLDERAKAAGPSEWLAAEFRLEDPNEIPGGFPPLESLSEIPVQKSIGFRRLRDAALGLDREYYCQLLLACFDALASRRQVLIAWDFGHADERELRRSVLYWLYTCLPYDLWASLSFDSVYTDKSAPGVIQLTFVDRTLIQSGGKTPSIRLGRQTLPLGGNFLVLDGEIIHNDNRYETKWYRQGGGYGSWLKQLVKIVWDSPDEKREAVVQALGDVQQSLQRQVSSMPEGKRLSPESYDRVCERNCGLQKLKEAAELVKPAPPVAKPEPTVVKPAPPEAKPEPPVNKPAVPLPEKREPSPSEVYQSIFQRRRQPPSLEDLKTLASIRGEAAPDAMGLLGAFMAREADQTSELEAVLRRYQGLPHDVYAQLICRLFWDGPAAKEQAIWNDCGASVDDQAAGRRRIKWYDEIAGAYDMAANFTVYFRDCLDKLPGVSGKWRAYMESECFQYLDIRFQQQFGSIVANRTTPAHPGGIQALSASIMRGGWMGAAAMGILGAFMAHDADTPGIPVLNYYQMLLPDLYGRLLPRLFWDEMTDVERNTWAKCGAISGVEAAKLRRFKMYKEIVEAFNPAYYNTMYYARSWINTSPGLSEQNRKDMEEEMQMVVNRERGPSVNGRSGV